MKEKLQWGPILRTLVLEIMEITMRKSRRLNSMIKGKIIQGFNFGEEPSYGYGEQRNERHNDKDDYYDYQSKNKYEVRSNPITF